MLIAEFSRRTGLTKDTIRFYVKRGLLKPDVGTNTSNRYQSFDAEQVERALIIRHAQLLGFTLQEIAVFDAEYSRAGMSEARLIELMRGRVALIDERIEKLERSRDYFLRKIAWIEGGSKGEPPSLLESVGDPRRVCR
ncbi:MerR family transcriptional regulator [Aliidongia dinghuensis]|uniref:MerR family transcriptional regulator n=1 Tax=Aliidongia dinghuensis TaxID=1867774 RepID=A0A8J3E1H1_9PROT|nr:MerR family transcriptional regulator [Aliidongia dinghuensis]GGE99848.1 MerR family transcriptional regulator [Aliidongia dinghuensis]